MTIDEVLEKYNCAKTNQDIGELKSKLYWEWTEAQNDYHVLSTYLQESERIKIEPPPSEIENTSKLVTEAKKYAERLVQLDNSIKAVVLVGSLVNGSFRQESDIDIALVFDPEPNMSPDGYIKIYSLQEKIENRILQHHIDLGFLSGSDIYLGGGLISEYRGDFLILWEKEIIKC